MQDLQEIAALAGPWFGTSTLWLSPGQEPHESDSLVVIVPVAGGKFVRLDYVWQHEGRPQEGSLLLGHDPRRGVATAVWIDSWHMGDRMMLCEGTIGEGGELDVRGSYAAPPGPDWGWHIVVDPESEEVLRISMYNVTPEGVEQVAIQGIYEPAQEIDEDDLPELGEEEDEEEDDEPETPGPGGGKRGNGRDGGGQTG